MKQSMIQQVVDRVPLIVGPDDVPRAKAVRVAFRRWWRHALNIGLLLIIVAVSAWFTATNMFQYPQYELDEGTYMGAAWAMMTRGDLFYYTYTYTHPPLGWLQIGLWATVTGGFDQFGMGINSGRTFMLVITVLSSIVIFHIVRIETKRWSAAAFAGLLFAVPPLSVSLHRQVYLDNIGTLWFLLSMLALLAAHGRFSRVVLSGLAMGIAFLSKEVFIVLFPGMMLFVWMESHPLQRRFSTVLWTIASGSLVSLFVLLAIIKDELLPPGVLWSSEAPHVSLIRTLTNQAGRGGGGIWHLDGSFWKNASIWWSNGEFFITSGTIALFLCLFLWRRSKYALSLPILAILFVLFLGRGGIVIYYYVIPLLAIMAIAVGVVIGHGINLLGRGRYVRRIGPPVVLSACVVLTSSAAGRNDLNFDVDNTTSQRLAAQWMVRNVPHGSMVVMDSFVWQDFRDDPFTGGQPFLNAHYYWPLFSDDVLVDSVLNNSWQTIDYLLVSPNTLSDARSFELPLMQQALDNADPIRTFNSGNWAQSIYRVRKFQRMHVSEDPVLVRTWAGDKERFIEDGRVVTDPATGETTSAGQAYAMIRAVYANDRAAFDSIWNWTTQNLQVRDDNLLASLWQPGSPGVGATVSMLSSTEADQDVAVALLFASRLWGDPAYEKAAQPIIHSIWDHETVSIGDARYIVAGDQASIGPNESIVAVSAIAPYAYRMFADADPSHPWATLVDSSYHLLTAIRGTEGLGGANGLFPDTVGIDLKTGKPHADGTIGYTEDGSRLLWRLTMDYLWYQDGRARDAINGFYFFRDQLVSEDGHLFASYSMDGVAQDGRESLAAYAAIVPSLLITDDPNLDAVHRTFTSKVLGSLADSEGGAHWGSDPDDYEAQTWAWMACAVMDGAITNLWKTNQPVEWDEVIPQLER